MPRSTPAISPWKRCVRRETVFYGADLNTEKGMFRVGAMICFDREFPESARILLLKGAELILTPNACPLDEPRLSQFKSRAWETLVGVAMANDMDEIRDYRRRGVWGNVSENQDIFRLDQ